MLYLQSLLFDSNSVNHFINWHIMCDTVIIPIDILLFYAVYKYFNAYLLIESATQYIVWDYLIFVKVYRYWQRYGFSINTKSVIYRCYILCI